MPLPSRFLAKTTPMSTVLNKVNELAQDANDFMVTIDQLNPVVKDGKFYVENNGNHFQFTQYAYSTASNRFENFPSAFAQALSSGDEKDAETLKKVWENATRHFEPKKEMLMRTRGDSTVRALLSDKYKIINNSWVLELFDELLPNTSVSHFRHDDPDMLFANILIPDSLREVDGEDYGAFISVGNSEIGNRKLLSAPGVYTLVCSNGMVMAKLMEDKVNKRHVGNIDLVELRKVIRQNVDKQIPIATAAIQNLLDTVKYSFNPKDLSVKSVLAQVVLENKLNRAEATLLLNSYVTEVQEREANKNTLFGVVNSLTRASQKLNPTRAFAVDSIAGDYVDNSKKNWDRLTTKAKSLTVDEVDGLLGLDD